MAEFSFGGEFVWRPDPAVVEQTNLRRFMRRHGIATLDGLIPRSLEDVAGSGRPCWPTWTSNSTSPTARSPISAAASSGPPGASAGR